jgi:predicted kinase
MKTLLLMMGLPRSGKSTWIRENLPKGACVICPDEFRLALHGKPYIRTAEPTVWAMVRVAVTAAFAYHDVVILDATNTTRHRRDEWVRGPWHQRAIHIIETSEAACMSRHAAEASERARGRDWKAAWSEQDRQLFNAIGRMARQWQLPVEEEELLTWSDIE